jgi:hypothetical protein
MAQLLSTESTSFTLDNMGRFLCNTLQEATDSAAQAVAGRQRDDYTVFLTNVQTGVRQQTTSFHNTDGERGRAPGLIGVQSYSGNVVAWRHIRIKP